MKQPMQACERLNALRRIGFTVEQGLEVDAREFCNDVGEANEAAEHAVAIEAVGKIKVARPADQIALVPIGARIRIEPEPQPVAIQRRIGG